VLGREIANLRILRDLTQNEASELAGVTQSRWSRFERGMFLTMDTIPLIAEALCILPSDLVKLAEDSMMEELEKKK
jgi:transcriptional regulator with XRE-family HTH domain